MAIVNNDWYNKNEGRAYPLDDSATVIDNSGAPLPTDIIADLNIRYPKALGAYPFLASLSITPSLVSLTLEVADTPFGPTHFEPLAALAVPQPIVPHVQVPILAQSSGVGGWVVLGQGALDRVGYQGRFAGPLQSLLTARACRSYRALPVTGLRDIAAGQLLPGIVRLRADPPLEIVAEDRIIANVHRKVIVIRIKANQLTQVAASSGAAQQLVPDTTSNPFAELAGPCAGRPESLTCGQPQPIEFINTVGPDCNGVLTIELWGCANVAALGDNGFVIDCHHSLQDACVPPFLPSSQGSLPDELPPVIVPPPIGPVTPPGGPPPRESISVVGSLPYTDCFDYVHLPGWFVPVAGQWGMIDDDTVDEIPYCPHPSQVGSASLVLPRGSYAALSPAVESLSLWEGFDPYTLGRKVITDFKMVDGGPGSRHNGGIVINYLPHPTAVDEFVYYLAKLDYDAQSFELQRYNGIDFQTIFAYSLPAIKLNLWYRMEVDVLPGTSPAVNVTVKVRGVGDPLAATFGPIAMNSYLPATGRFGLYANHSETRFSFFRTELTYA